MKPQEPTYFNLGLGEDETQRNYFSLFPEELMASVIESFVINNPMIGKAGGDGFWVHQDEEHLYIVLFDCMGHGHLASMMTRVYTQSLQKIVQEEDIKDPGTILRYLHHKIGVKFKKRENLQVGTGADVGVLKINLAVRKIEYAGAKTDLFHVQDGNLEVIKADRMQIGEMWEYPHHYNTRNVPLMDGVKSNFYLSSDGFKDLMGGPEGKKLGKKQMNEIIESQYGKSMMEQKEDVLLFMKEWSGSHMLIDDVLIVGCAL